jgi:broad specificity phosphatase PhoE
MRVILLRHEERGVDVGFFSELTTDGFINSMELPKKLINYNIDFIFSSPFVRTLETSFFISLNRNIPVNVEYALHEYLHSPYFLFHQWYYPIDEIKNKRLTSIVNRNYKSIITKDYLKVLEDEKNLERRIIPFFDYLLNNYPSKTILIISHKGVINKIKDLYVKKTDMDDEFPMGHFEVYNIL